MESFRSVGLLLVLMGMQTGMVEAVCHGGWSQYGSSCYLFNAGPVSHTWSDSRLRCQDQDGDLVTIDTTQERDWIVGQTNRYVNSRPPIAGWWTGLYAPPGSNTWQWPNTSTTGIEVLNGRWAQGQPNRTSVNMCVSIHNNQFSVSDCTLSLNVICERPLDKPLTCDLNWHLDSGLCYNYYGGPQTYDEASQNCKNAGATLAKVTDMTTQKAVSEQAIIQHQNIWIALRSVGTGSDGRYQWVWPDGSVLRQGYWAATPPLSLGGNVNKTCVEQTQSNVAERSWNPVTCDQRRPFVCQKPQGSCPAGWLQFTSRCFNIYTQSPKSFSGAQAFCQGMGGDLITLDSWDLVQYIWPYVNHARSAGADRLWIGLTDYNHDSGPWVWVSGNVTVSWTNWPRQENYNMAGKQDCIAVESTDDRLQWRALGNCGLLNTFICQLPVNKAILHPTQPPKHYSCPSGFTLYQGSASCLQMNQHDRSWADARADCKSQGADLVTIDNSRLNDYIRGLVQAQMGKYWIGLHDRSNENNFHWLDSTTRPAFLYWHQGEPNNQGGNQNCVAIYPQDSFRWWDDDCTAKYNYICQMNAIVNGHPPLTTHRSWSTRCGPLWEEDPNSNSCYMIVADRLTWMDARDACHSYSGDLLSINSVTEQFYINGEPNNQGEADCGVIAGADGRWSDFPCNTRYSFICEKQAAGVTTTTTARPTVPAHLPSGKMWGCGRGWRGFSGQCYTILLLAAVQWSAAKVACGQQGASLVSVHSDGENNFVYSLVPSSYHGNVWLGLNDVTRMGSFEWSDMTPVTFTQWKTSQPNNAHNEHCVAMANSKNWAVYNCNANSVGAYICKKPMALQDAADIALTRGCSQGLGFGAQCYLFVDSPFRSWTSAQMDCRRLHGNLVTVNNRLIQAFVSAEMLSRGTPYWIGLSSTGPLDSTYVWSANYSLDFTYWGSNHTGNEVGMCVAMTPGRPIGLWQNFACTRSMPYICELPRSGFTTPPPTPTTPVPRVNCSQGWVTLDTLCVKTFNVSQGQRLSWMESRAQCQTFSGELLDVRSKQMEDKIISQVFNNVSEGDWWIGLNDRDSENGHVWSDGQGTVYTNWLPGEPDDYNNREDCVVWHFPTDGSGQHGWLDTNCYAANRYICYVRRRLHPALYTTPVPATGVISSLCPNSTWLMYGGHCYFLSPERGTNAIMTWFDARRTCQSLQAELVSVHSLDENGFLTTAMSKSQRSNFWLGLNDLSTTGYRWTDGSPVDFVSWDVNEPDNDNGGESCVESDSVGAWNDNNCMDLNGYICKQLPQGATTSAPTLSPVAGGCPQGFTSAPFLEKCYMVAGLGNDSRLNFTQALSFCQLHVTPAATLLSIHHSLEQRYVTSLIGTLSLPIWIGLNDLKIRNYFVWQDNSEVDFTYWGPGEPDENLHSDDPNDRRDCVALNTQGQISGSWNDMNCGMQNPFICQVNRVPNLATPQPQNTGCQAEYTKQGGRCYRYFPTPHTWNQARAVCQQDGGTLATPSDPNQNSIVGLMRIPDRQHASSISDIWIGLSFVDNMMFQWVNHWPVRYTSWASNEPDNSGQCVKMDNGFFWHDHPCDATYPFVCQQGGSPFPTTTTVRGLCDNGWTAHSEFCYHLTMDSVRSWPGARFACGQLGSELVSVHSKEEMDFVNSLFVTASGNSRVVASSDAGGVWLGLSKAADNGFAWSDGTGLQFDNWDQGEPSDSDGGQHQDCVQWTAVSGRWNDVDCFSSNYYMCKRLQAPNRGTINPQQQTGSSDGGAGGLSAGALAGITIGATAIIAIAILVGLLLRGRLPFPARPPAASESQGRSFDNALYIKEGKSEDDKDSVSFGANMTES